MACCNDNKFSAIVRFIRCVFRFAEKERIASPFKAITVKVAEEY